MADEKIITSSVFEQGITEIMQDIANNLYEFEEYTEEEVADLMDLSEEEVAELTRVINDTTVALNKVYSNKKVEDLLSELEVTCNKYADEKIGGLANIHLAYVDSLPSLGEDNTIYILKSTTGNDTLNLYDGTSWISIGEFAISLDNYYDKAEVDALLNDKANANEVIGQDDVVSDMSNISSSTVLSTAGLEVELNKKVNLDDMTTELDKKVDKDNIVTVLDDTVTDEQVPSAKAVYDTTVDKNIKTYCLVSQLGLSSGCSVGDIFNAMPIGSIGRFDYNGSTITDIPSINGGVLLIDKCNAYRFSIEFKESAYGSVANNNMWIGQLQGSDGSRLTWTKVCTSRVADVKETSLEIDETALGLPLWNNRSKFKVINGICYVTIEFNVNAHSNDITYGYKKVNTTSLPKIGFNTKGILNVLDNTCISAVLDKDSTDFKLHGVVRAKEGSYTIQGSFSYPVAEE